MADNNVGFAIALEEARIGFQEGGVPVRLTTYTLLALFCHKLFFVVLLAI